MRPPLWKNACLTLLGLTTALWDLRPLTELRDPYLWNAPSLGLLNLAVPYLKLCTSHIPPSVRRLVWKTESSHLQTGSHARRLRLVATEGIHHPRHRVLTVQLL